MIQLYERFGDKNYFAAIDELLSRNRKAVGSLIKDVIPDEPVFFEDWVDDDGRGTGPWKVACTMSKKDGILKLDFTGVLDNTTSHFYQLCKQALIPKVHPP